VTVEKSGITCFIIQNKPGVDRVSRAGCGGASVFVFMDAMRSMASIYSFVRGAWPDLLANSSSPIGDRGTKVTDDNIGRTLSIIWKKNHIDAPYRLGGGSSGVFFFCHVSIAPAYRYDATVGDRKADHFGE
jgi:hypothetical protein